MQGAEAAKKTTNGVGVSALERVSGPPLPLCTFVCGASLSGVMCITQAEWKLTRVLVLEGVDGFLPNRLVVDVRGESIFRWASTLLPQQAV
ncbi:hypothetical protein R1flu_026138 [Riccia fluitans]|uniref:Uncharacterized protein n=1 Tax=Riccia fluitans TaxID=41844 RepID=A0ABD1XF45_9MARC